MNCRLYLQVVFCCLVELTFGRDGFLKDQNEDLVEFPPKVLQSFDSNIPVGHLRPLGWQRFPQGIVEELDGMPSPAEFHELYVTSYKPVVFRNVLDNVPAMEKWEKKNYLKDKYGKIEVDVVVKKEIFKKGPRRMKFEKFLKDYLYEDWYLTNFVPQEMMGDLILPNCLRCGFVRWLMESELWMSSGGTSSLLHSHADHDLHCLIAGRKDFIFIENKYKQIFNYHEKTAYEGAGYSDLDMDQINMFKYKGIADAPWIWSTLRSGDCIFVPAGFLHQVRSYGKSISYTNHFAPSPNLDLTSCTRVGEKGLVLLSDVNFLWTYYKGKLLLSNSKLSAESTRHYLLMVMRNQTYFTEDLFSSFYEEVMAEAQNYPAAKEAWSIIALKKENDTSSLSRSDIENLPAKTLKQLAEVLNLPHNQLSAKLRDEL